MFELINPTQTAVVDAPMAAAGDPQSGIHSYTYYPETIFFGVPWTHNKVDFGLIINVIAMDGNRHRIFAFMNEGVTLYFRVLVAIVTSAVSHAYICNVCCVALMLMISSQRLSLLLLLLVHLPATFCC